MNHIGTFGLIRQGERPLRSARMTDSNISSPLKVPPCRSKASASRRMRSSAHAVRTSRWAASRKRDLGCNLQRAKLTGEIAPRYCILDLIAAVVD